jgi:hypothetical protein
MTRAIPGARPSGRLRRSRALRARGLARFLVPVEAGRSRGCPRNPAEIRTCASSCDAVVRRGARLRVQPEICPGDRFIRGSGRNCLVSVGTHAHKVQKYNNKKREGGEPWMLPSTAMPLPDLWDCSE